MKCLIIETDTKTLNFLEKTLKASSLVKQVFSCANVEQAFDIAMEHEIDLVFVDFVKPGVNGIGFLDELPYGRPQVIVTSAKREVAKDAYDHLAVDFLLKPVKGPRLMKALARAVNQNEAKQSRMGDRDNLFVKVDGSYVRVAVKDIYLVEAASDYLKIYTTEKEYTVYASFKRLMDNLSTKEFMRVHRSYIVRLSSIDAIEDGTIRVEKHQVPISINHKADLMARLKIL
jgi:DNA-binding LytR/AlgR family response regulator